MCTTSAYCGYFAEWIDPQGSNLQKGSDVPEHIMGKVEFGRLRNHFSDSNFLKINLRVDPFSKLLLVSREQQICPVRPLRPTIITPFSSAMVASPGGVHRRTSSRRGLCRLELREEVQGRERSSRPPGCPCPGRGRTPETSLPLAHPPSSQTVRSPTRRPSLGRKGSSARLDSRTPWQIAHGQPPMVRH